MGRKWRRIAALSAAVAGAFAVAAVVVSAGLASPRDEAATSAATAVPCLPPPVAQTQQTSGQIDWATSLQPLGALKAIMLFVDYADRPANQTTTDVFDRHVPRATQWLSAVSYGRVSLTVTPVNQWFRMPRLSTQYITRANSTFALHRQMIQDAVAAANPTVDFSGYQLIYVVSPSGSGVDVSPAFTPNSPTFGVTADGNNFTHGATFGNDFYLNDVYGSNVLVHETGHTFGLPDLYNFDQATFPFSTFVGDWDMMGNLDVGAGFLAWQRLQIGWIDPGQIACLATAPDTRDVRLSPVEQGGGTKAVVVQTGTNTFTVAEYRQAVAEDALICDAGMLVYTVDATVTSGHGSIRVRPAAPDDGSKSLLRCGPFYNAAFDVGDTAYSAGGVSLKVICKVGGDIVVRAALGQALGSAPSPLCGPGSPTAVSAVAGDGQAVVSFTPPAADASPLLYFTVTALPGGRSASGVASPITVGGLANGTSYSFTVTATSANGTSVASAASAPVVPAAEPRPHPEPPAAAARPAVPAFTPPVGPRKPPPAH